MEKLIELLNQFDENRKIGKYGIYKREEYQPNEEIIISKKFGFIKWLVENDKIDRDKKLKEDGLFRKYFYDLEYVKNYDRLIMWLSVEDSPIELLVSILK